MHTLHAARALLPQGWQRDVRLTLSAGRIATVEAGLPAQAGDEHHALLLPGMANLHSHAHQRGMAGLAEHRGPVADSFWTWREAMYRHALVMQPEQLEAIAGQLYVEMLEAGYTRVGEFHYLHHDPAGVPYDNPAEMVHRLVAAAALSGIGLTLLPVFYAHAGFGGHAPGAAQRRFVTGLDAYARLLEASQVALHPLPGAVLGIAPHSLRAVTPDELRALLQLADGLLGADSPVHIHIAEQIQEVADCVAWCGARPVQWLLDHAPVNLRWCLVHATHMDADETRRAADSGAIAGLCPITEANLGDGIFDAPAWLAYGGRWGIGSDSNVQIGVTDELRLLEYSQRLVRRERNVMAGALNGSSSSTGRSLFDAAVAGGAAALGVPAAGLAEGAPADLVSLQADHPALLERRGDALLDAWIFSGARAVDCVWVGGHKQVEAGRHRQRAEVAQAFRVALAALRKAEASGTFL